MARHPDNLGAKLGPRIVQLIVDAMGAHKRQSAPYLRDLAMLIQHDFFSLTGTEIRSTIGPLLADIAQHQDVHPDVRKLMKFMSEGHGQLATMLVNSAVGTAAGATLGSLLGPALAPYVWELNLKLPTILPAIGTVAQMVARELVDLGTARDLMGRQGMNASHADMMIAASESGLDTAGIIEAVRRKRVSREVAFHLLKFAGIRDLEANISLDMSDVPLSPADLADMVVRGILPQGEAALLAAQSGVPEGDFGLLVLDTGEPPSLTDLMEAYRRGFINQSRLVHGIRQSRLRDEWTDVMEALRFQPMSTADAITAAVQGHVTLQFAQTIAEQNGLEAQHFNPLYQSAGEPISKTEVIQLLRRGIIDRSTAVQALRESRLKDKYINQVLDEIRYLPPVREIGTMYGHGVLTEAQASQLMAEQGADAEITKAVLNTAISEKIHHVKLETEGMAVGLYLEHAIDRAQLIQTLKALGYTEQVAELIVTLQDHKIEKTNRDHAIGRVRAEFTAHKLDVGTAETRLDTLGVTSDQRAQLLADWELELKLNVRVLTPAQIVDAWYVQVFDVQQATGRLVQLGYDAADALVLLEIKNKGPIGGA